MIALPSIISVGPGSLQQKLEVVTSDTGDQCDPSQTDCSQVCDPSQTDCSSVTVAAPAPSQVIISGNVFFFTYGPSNSSRAYLVSFLSSSGNVTYYAYLNMTSASLNATALSFANNTRTVVYGNLFSPPAGPQCINDGGKFSCYVGLIDVTNLVKSDNNGFSPPQNNFTPLFSSTEINWLRGLGIFAAVCGVLLIFVPAKTRKR